MSKSEHWESSEIACEGPKNGFIYHARFDCTLTRAFGGPDRQGHDVAGYAVASWKIIPDSVWREIEPAASRGVCVIQKGMRHGHGPNACSWERRGEQWASAVGGMFERDLPLEDLLNDDLSRSCL